MNIHVLDPEVVSGIAAGEVVERPASVVKELVENALDAGATRIRIEAWEGGVKLIRATDDGCGIPPAEAELAFKRHATSKIDTLTDLESLSTLGFRGEALASIAAVAEVEMVTRTAADLAGIYLKLRQGSVVEKEPRGCPRGTMVAVRNLFRVVPARLKFLKSPVTENGHIADVVTRYSLAYPEVGFGLYIDGREVISTPGSGDLREVTAVLYGWETARQLLEVREDAAAKLAGARVKGLVGPAAVSRSNRSYMSFFVNRRYVQSAALARAVEEAYQGLLARDKYPVAILNLTLPPRDFDVNVHPAKREVRFRDGQGVFSAVYKAVQETLGRAPYPKNMTVLSSPAGKLEWKPEVAAGEGQQQSLPLSPAEAPYAALPILRVVGQLASTYIVAEGPDGLYLVDQHAAHERVLFEKCLAMVEKGEPEAQGLLEPVLVELSPRQEALYKERGKIAGEFGLSLEPFGERTYLVRAVPAALKGPDLSRQVVEVVDALSEGKTAEDGREKVAASVACHGAVRAGQVLGHEEMRELVRQLEQARQPRTCPHGRPTMVHLSSGLLEKEFGRR